MRSRLAACSLDTRTRVLACVQGGAAATGTGELLAALHGHVELPGRDEWMSMLAHSGFPDAEDVWSACDSQVGLRPPAAAADDDDGGGGGWWRR